MMRRNKKQLRPTLITGLCIAALSMALMGCSDTAPEEPAAEESVLETAPEETAEQEAVETEAPETETEPENTAIETAEQLLNPEYELHGTAPESSSELASAQAENQNTIAWLTFPETTVNAAIIQETNGEAVTPGTVTLDAGNSADFMDPNIILHGAAAAEEDPFYPLLAYGDPEYFDSHPYFYIQADGMLLEYQVFAAYETQPEPILINYNCYDYDEYVSYIDGIYDRRDMGMVTNETLRETVYNAWSILTLEALENTNTCRLVHAVLTGKQIQE